MCGIVGYIGTRPALDVILGGLEKLEYRGYDSAGVAIIENGDVFVARALGKLSELKRVLNDRNGGRAGTVGIGHTRWATHGKPSENNAHPHTAGVISLIHNGIIENYNELREGLIEKGCEFRSETDTEVAAHLLNDLIEQGLSPLDALRTMCSKIRGSYAFLAIAANSPDRILVAKNSTPIIIGLGEGEMIIASDIPAVLSSTRRILVLEDGDIAEVRPDKVLVEHGGKRVEREVQTVTWDPVTAQKGGFKHYMLKEIHEQPQALADTFRGRIEHEQGAVFLPEISLSTEALKDVQRIVLVACGTAWHACLVAKFFLEQLAKIPCEVDYASEFRYREPVLDKHTLVIGISQSGETADTLAAIETGAKHSQVVAICNVLGSSLSRKVKNTLFTHAGPEISVASTKAFTTQLVGAYLLALHLGIQRNVLPSAQTAELVQALVRLPAAVDGALKTMEQVESVARSFYTARDFLYLGRGNCYPVALEGALKLKEISYIHAEGYPAGEMKHGPIALIDERMPVVVVMQRSAELFDKTLSNLREVESRGGKIIVVTDGEHAKELSAFASAVIEVPYVSAHLSPIVLTVPLQLLAYHIAVLNGTDVDLPRNLAKSVTVE